MSMNLSPKVQMLLKKRLKAKFSETCPESKKLIQPKNAICDYFFVLK